MSADRRVRDSNTKNMFGIKQTRSRIVMLSISRKVQERFTSISKRFDSMDVASVSWGTRRAIHFRGKMWMARQFDTSGLIAVGAISL